MMTILKKISMKQHMLPRWLCNIANYVYNLMLGKIKLKKPTAGAGGPIVKESKKTKEINSDLVQKRKL